MRFTLSIFMVSILLPLLGCDSTADTDGKVSDGAQLSHLQLTDLDGAVVKLSDYRGKQLVINFWATWCGPCREEMPALQALSEQLDPQRYAVLGVSVDQDPQQVRRFLAEQQIRFKQFVDPQMQLAMSELQIRAFPETLVVSADGQVLRRILGPRQWQDPAYFQAILGDD